MANRWNGWKPPIEADDDQATPATTRGKSAPAPEAEAQVAPAAPDADGVVRTKTGWRKLLPGILGRDRDEA